MAKKHKIKFGTESIIRLGVFIVLIYLAIGFLSNSTSNINISSFDPKVLGDFSPQIQKGQQYLENEINKYKNQALDQLFLKIRSQFK